MRDVDQIVATLRETADEIERNPLTAGAAVLVYDRFDKTTTVAVRHPANSEEMLWRALTHRPTSGEITHEAEVLRAHLAMRVLKMALFGVVGGAAAAMLGLALWLLSRGW